MTWLGKANGKDYPILADLDERGAKVVILQYSRRVSPRQIDAEIYKWRHLIENFFCKLKEFKRIATRACRTWPAAGLVDTEIRCFDLSESRNAEKEVQPRVQA